MSMRRTVTEAIVYGFAVGRVRVLEGRLLNNAALERLLDATSFERQKRVLADTEYGSWLEKAETAKDVEEALDAYLTELLDFLDGARLPEPVIRFFRARHDYANLKGRFKAEALSVPLEGLLVGHGVLHPDVFAGPLEMLPADMRALDAAVRDDDEIVRDRIDPLVDAAMFRTVLQAARESRSRFLLELAILTVDLANVKLVLRAKMLDWPLAATWSAIVAGGKLDAKDLMDRYSMPSDELAARVAGKEVFRGITPEELLEVERLDVLADNVLMSHAKKARMIATGIEPVIAYAMARQSELVILRMLLMGRIAGLSKEKLRKRLRDLYV